MRVAKTREEANHLVKGLAEDHVLISTPVCTTSAQLTLATGAEDPAKRPLSRSFLATGSACFSHFYDECPGPLWGCAGWGLPPGTLPPAEPKGRWGLGGFGDSQN